MGWGEAVADYPFYSYESGQTNLHVMKDYLAPVALGSAWRDIGEYRAAIAHVNGHNMAKDGMELAFWDLLGKRSGKSVQELLGDARAGARGRVGRHLRDAAGVAGIGREVPRRGLRAREAQDPAGKRCRVHRRELTATNPRSEGEAVAEATLRALDMRRVERIKLASRGGYRLKRSIAS